MPKFHAALKSGYAGYSAELDFADFPTREACQAEIDRLGLSDKYEVREGSVLQPMKPFFPQ